MQLLYDPEIATWTVIPDKWKFCSHNIGTQMLEQLHLYKKKIGNNCISPSMGECFKQMWYIYLSRYIYLCNTIQHYKVMSYWYIHTACWMNFHGLSEWKNKIQQYYILHHSICITFLKTVFKKERKYCQRLEKECRKEVHSIIERQHEGFLWWWNSFGTWLLCKYICSHLMQLDCTKHSPPYT